MTKRKQKVGKKMIASASTALLFGTILGLLQTAILSFAAKPLLYAMGLKHVTSFFHHQQLNIILLLIFILNIIINYFLSTIKNK